MPQDEFFSEFEAVFAELARRRARPGPFEPDCDVYLSAGGDTVVVTVEIAGAETSELTVVAEERTLAISGRRVDRERAARGNVLMKEIEYGLFVKKIHLPVPVAYAQATAEYRDGMLAIRIPVAEDSHRPVHRTEVRMTVRRIPV